MARLARRRQLAVLSLILVSLVCGSGISVSAMAPAGADLGLPGASLLELLATPTLGARPVGLAGLSSPTPASRAQTPAGSALAVDGLAPSPVAEDAAGRTPAPEATRPAVATATPAPTVTPIPAVEPGIFFDDFSYSASHDAGLAAFGWSIRAIGRGVPGAGYWLSENVSFVDDPERPGNRMLQLSASSAGSRESSTQAEIHHQQKFLEGTYASRVRFSDAPAAGPDGDQIVQTFYAISPHAFDMDPNYAEIDFEYLPNGGWEVDGATLWMTTWETFQARPFVRDNAYSNLGGSLEGWHTLLIHVRDGQVSYFLDGALLATHDDDTYPETAMSISFNLWFDGLLRSSEQRSYTQQVDWVYYVEGRLLTTSQVEGVVAGYRRRGQPRLDSVPDRLAPLALQRRRLQAGS